MYNDVRELLYPYPSNGSHYDDSHLAVISPLLGDVEGTYS